MTGAGDGGIPAPDPHRAAAPGAVIAGRYTLRALAGSGGMGAVWRAEDPTLGREVAVKEIRVPGEADDGERLRRAARALREVRAAAAIRHPNVVSVYDVVEDGGRPWIVMEYVPGRTLAQALASGRLPLPEAARVCRDVLDGLVAAHAAGVVHRDVKPANVLLSPDGRAILTDFGVASLAGETTLTGADGLVGTPGYLAPEQATGRPGPAADLWALGATLYHMVEGRPPFRRDGHVATLHAVLTGEYEPPVHAGPLTAVVTGWLTVEPGARMPAAVARDLLDAAARSAAGTSSSQAVTAAGPVAARPPRPAYAPAPIPAVPDGGTAIGERAIGERAIGDATTADLGGAGATPPVTAVPDGPAPRTPPPDAPAGRGPSGPRRRRGVPAAAIAAVIAVAAVLAVAGIGAVPSRVAGTGRAGGDGRLHVREDPGRASAASPAPGPAGSPAAVTGSPAPGSPAPGAGTPGAAAGDAGTGGAPPSATASGRPAGEASRPGFRRVSGPSGFTLLVPDGWTGPHRENGRVFYRSPGDVMRIGVYVDPPDGGGDPYAELAAQDNGGTGRSATASYPGYRRLRLEPAGFPGATAAALWEFGWYDQEAGARRRSVDLRFVTGGRTYDFWVSGPEADADRVLAVFDAVRDGFTTPA